MSAPKRETMSVSGFVKSTKGTAAVEFAIISMLLLTILFGIFEGGRVFYGWLVITNEAREGARWGAVRFGDWTPAIPDEAALETAVRVEVTRRATSQIKTDASVFGVNATANDTAVTVTITHTVEIITPMISAFWRDFPLAAESTMRSE